jgi:hypothetical protein
MPARLLDFNFSDKISDLDPEAAHFAYVEMVFTANTRYL